MFDFFHTFISFHSAMTCFCSPTCFPFPLFVNIIFSFYVLRENPHKASVEHSDQELQCKPVAESRHIYCINHPGA